MSDTLSAAPNHKQGVWVRADELFPRAISKLQPAEIVLDIGCGIRPQNYIIPRVHICCEPFEQYIDILKENVKNDTSREYSFVNADWEKALEIFPEKSVDTIFLVDIIEHLPKEKSLKLLKDTERIARSQIAVFTTLGFIPQHHPDGKDAWGLDGGAWQEHKSGWEPEDFGAGWDILVAPDFHKYDNLGIQYEVPHGAIWAIKTLPQPIPSSVLTLPHDPAQYLPAALGSSAAQAYPGLAAVIASGKYIKNDSKLIFEIKPQIGNHFDLSIHSADKVAVFSLPYNLDLDHDVKLDKYFVNKAILYKQFLNGYVFNLNNIASGFPLRIAFTIKNSSVKGGGTINVYRYVEWLVDLGVEVTIYSDDKLPDWTNVKSVFKHIQNDQERYASIEEPIIIVYSVLELVPLLRFGNALNKRIFHFCQGVEEFHYIRLAKDNILDPIPIFDILNSLPVGRIAVSHHIESYYLRKYGQKTFTILNGIDLLTFIPRAPKPLGRHIKILTAGNPAHSLKGIPPVMMAIAALSRKYPDLVFEVVNCCGERMAPHLLPDFSPLGIKYSLHFCLSAAEMREMYHAADIYVNGSFYEGFGYPTLEAMACGVPVVHVDNHGLDDIVHNEMNCLVVHGQDAGATALAIGRLIFDQPLRERLIENGINTAQEFSQSHQFSLFVDQFQEILGTTFEEEQINLVQRRLLGESGVQPLFSVLIPTYNQARYLPACLDSLLAQTCGDWEAVIVDDGSSDDTKLVLQKYADRDKRFKVYHKENGGVGTALNMALQHAAGEWICWLSSDDLFKPDKLAVHRRAFLQYPEVSFFHTGYWVLEEATGQILPFTPPSGFIPAEHLQVLKFFQINYVNGISIAVRRAVFQTVGSFREDLPNGQDFDMWLRISAYYRSKYLPERTCVTRVHPAQGTSLSVNAGIYDSSISCLTLLNKLPFTGLFPCLDMGDPLYALHAIDAVMPILSDTASFINRCGFGAALVERMCEWLSGQMPDELRRQLENRIRTFQAAEMSPILADVQEVARDLIDNLRAHHAFDPHNDLDDIARHVPRLHLSGHPEATDLKIYFEKRSGLKRRLSAERPFFSVLVPTYNQAGYLPACLDSLITQAHADWEAVVIDDGSTDDTSSAIGLYERKDVRIKGLHKQNGGVATALNEGLRHAHGEWICWLSSDDLFEPDALATFSEAIRLHPDARFFHSDFSEMDDQTGIRTPSAPGRHLHLPDEATQVVAFFRANYVHGISIAVHRSVFEAVGTFNPDLRYAQDVDMWLRISARYRLHHINHRTCITRVHGAMGTVGFTEAGPMDVARSCLDFLNKNRFAALFPLLDFRQPEHLVKAVNATMQSMMTLQGDMYRGIGFMPALLERFCEWLWCDCDAAVREVIIKALVPVAESLKASLPQRLLRALDALLTRKNGDGAGYRPHDYYRELAEQYHGLLMAGKSDEAEVLARYMKLQKGEASERLRQELAQISAASKAGDDAIVVGSRLAHRWLDGLAGLEIGASAHNTFGLNTRNVGMRDAIYEAEQTRLTGKVAPIHIEALADDIPVADESEEFIFSSHVIEHCPNLIKTLLEWFRIVKKDGFIYMIVPHRDAASSDASRPLTEWRHILADFSSQADGLSEPEAGQLGHCHYHVFDIATMRGFIDEVFGRRLELVDYQEVDDKIGNGFTLVYRKTVSLAESMPWPYWEQLVVQKAQRSNGAATIVNIGMITYNRLEFTRQAIDALVKFTDSPYVLTVVDNNSEDGTRTYLREMMAQGVITNLVLLDENIGVAKASNIAWSLEPDAGYYLKLDNDIVIQKRGWLSAMVHILKDTPQLGALAYSFEPTSYPLQVVNEHTVRLKNGNLGGACFLIPARTRERIGYWCEDYGLYSEEDFDYCYRMYLAGIQFAYMEDEDIGLHLPAGRAAKIDEKSLEATDGVEEERQQTYRLWKDEIRRQTIRSGLRDSNLLAYKSGVKPLYAKSEAVERWTGQGRPGLCIPAPPVMSHGTTPLKIAVFSHDDSSHACGYYRLYSPAQALLPDAEFRWPVRTEGGSVKIDLQGLDKSDLFIIQRFFPHEMSAPVIKQLMATGKPVIFELDDYITAIPPSNPSHEWAQQCIGHIEECIKECDAVTVSTEALKEVFSSLNPSIFVLPNLIDDTLWAQPSPSSGEGKIIIGFTGTNTHIADITSLEETLERIAAAHPGEVSFTFMGCATERLSRLPGFTFIPFETTYEAYARKLQQIPIDIALVPLEDNPFNRCKSNIKWLEYSACGVAGIYADLTPYNTTIEHGNTGLLVGNDPQQWFDAIDLLIKNPELRRSIAANARRKVLSEYTLKTGAHCWLDAYRQVIAAHGEKLQRNVPHTEAASHEAIAKPGPSALVSIVIPLFNRVDLTRRCLEALSQTVGASVPHEIILVDNGSTDATEEYLRLLGNNVVIIRNSDNLGFAKACNQGARAASRKYLLFLNNDTVPQPGWLEPLIKVLEDDSSVAAAGSKLLYPDGTIQHAGVMMVDNRAGNDPLCGEHIWRGRPGDLPEANQPYRYQALTAACLLVRRTAFEVVQGFDEGYWNGYEDVDLCFKLGRQGWKLVYQPQSVVIHHESKSGSERFSRVAGNIERLHRTWLGRITPDMVIQVGGRVEQTGSAIGPYGGEGARPAPIVSIIVPLYNQAQLTKACVEAVRATAGDPERYELILVDNDSRDWTREYVKSLGDSVTVITNSDNLGFARACNQGAQVAKGKYLLFLNNDTVPRAGWLEALLAGAEEDGADIVGGKLLYPNGRVQHAGVAFNKNGIGYHIFRNFPADAPAVNKKRLMQCVTAACLLVSRQLFIEFGGFDEHFHNGFEDVDFCLRAGQSGRRVLYTPHAVVVHHEEQSEGRKQFDAQNMQRYLARWQGKVRCDDEELYDTEGFSVQWHADGSCTVRQRGGEAARPAGRYPLVPLVGSYAETPLARLSASPRMKAVLKAYSGGSGVRDVPTL